MRTGAVEQPGQNSMRAFRQCQESPNFVHARWSTTEEIRAHRARVAHLMKPDECASPVDAGCFRAQAVVRITDAFPHALQKTLSMDGAAGQDKWR